MSNATELHDEIMDVILSKMQSGEVTYEDVFGALVMAKTFFEVEYAGRLTAAWGKVLDEEGKK